MKLTLYYVVRKYTNAESIIAFGEIRYHAGPFKNWMDADSERCNLRKPEDYAIVNQNIEVEYD